MIRFVGEAQREVFGIFLICFANNQWILVVRYIHDYVNLPSSQQLAMSIQRPTSAYDPPQVNPRKRIGVVRVRMYAIYVCFSKTDNRFWLSYSSYHFKADELNGEYRYLSMDAVQIIIIDAGISYSYRLSYVQSNPERACTAAFWKARAAGVVTDVCDSE